jgi:hypothetical protein
MACQFPLLALLASICSPLLNCLPQMMFSPQHGLACCPFCINVQQALALSSVFGQDGISGEVFLFSLLELISLRNPWVVG